MTLESALRAYDTPSNRASSNDDIDLKPDEMSWPYFGGAGVPCGLQVEGSYVATPWPVMPWSSSNLGRGDSREHLSAMIHSDLATVCVTRPKPDHRTKSASALAQSCINSPFRSHLYPLSSSSFRKHISSHHFPVFNTDQQPSNSQHHHFHHTSLKHKLTQYQEHARIRR